MASKKAKKASAKRTKRATTSVGNLSPADSKRVKGGTQRTPRVGGDSFSFGVEREMKESG
jgi:hypothetical protein